MSICFALFIFFKGVVVIILARLKIEYIPNTILKTGTNCERSWTKLHWVFQSTYVTLELEMHPQSPLKNLGAKGGRWEHSLISLEVVLSKENVEQSCYWDGWNLLSFVFP